MTPIKLRITRDEFYVVANTATSAATATGMVMLRPMLSLNTVLMAEWYRRTDRQLYTWSDRTSTKEYAYALPTSVALALHHSLRLNCPNHAGQTLLEKLNQHLVNAGFQPYDGPAETIENQ